MALDILSIAEFREFSNFAAGSELILLYLILSPSLSRYVALSRMTVFFSLSLLE